MPFDNAPLPQTMQTQSPSSSAPTSPLIPQRPYPKRTVPTVLGKSQASQNPASSDSVSNIRNRINSAYRLRSKSNQAKSQEIPLHLKQIRNLKSQLSDREQQLAHKGTILFYRENELAAARDRVASLERQRATLERQSEARQLRERQIQYHLHVAESEIANLNLSLAQLSQRSARREQLLKEQLAITNKHLQEIQYDRQILAQELKKTRDRLKDETKGWQDRVAQLQRQCGGLEKEVKSVRHELFIVTSRTRDYQREVQQVKEEKEKVWKEWEKEIQIQRANGAELRKKVKEGDELVEVLRDREKQLRDALEEQQMKVDSLQHVIQSQKDKIAELQEARQADSEYLAKQVAALKQLTLQYEQSELENQQLIQTLRITEQEKLKALSQLKQAMRAAAKRQYKLGRAKMELQQIKKLLREREEKAKQVIEEKQELAVIADTLSNQNSILNQELNVLKDEQLKLESKSAKLITQIQEIRHQKQQKEGRLSQMLGDSIMITQLREDEAQSLQSQLLKVLHELMMTHKEVDQLTFQLNCSKREKELAQQQILRAKMQLEYLHEETVKLNQQICEKNNQLQGLGKQKDRLEQYISNLEEHLGEIDKALAEVVTDDEAENPMKRRKHKIDQWIKKAVALGKEVESSNAKASALLAEKEQLQRYLDTELPQLQQKLAQTTKEIKQLYTGKEMAETQLNQKTQTVDRYAHLMNELSNRVSLFIGEKKRLEKIIEEVEEKNQFLITKVNNFKANEEVVAIKQKMQKNLIKARDSTIKNLNQVISSFKADLTNVKDEIAVLAKKEKGGSDHMEGGLFQCCKLVNDLHSKHCHPEKH